MPTLSKSTQDLDAAVFPALLPSEATIRDYREALRRVLASAAFARCERLSALLTFVCEMALNGREGELNEQRIGQAVFGRSPEYDSSADGIVRTQASRLRQRLDLFYEQDGREESIRVVIPKGGYIPLFKAHLPLAEIASASAAEQPKLSDARPARLVELPSGRPLSRSGWLPWALCCLLVGVLLSSWIGSASRRGHSIEAGHPLWGRVFLQGRPTLVVPADSGLVLSYLVDRREVSLHDYLSGEYRSRTSAQGSALAPELANFRADVMRRPYTSIVDLDASVKLAQFAQEAHSGVQIRYARDLRPNDIKHQNVVLIGAREANPWVELFEHKMNFVLQDDFGKTFSVVNRSPHPGESSQWTSRTDDADHRVYGVVAFLPNLSGDGDALLVEGTSVAGTEAAWDFVSDDAALLPFLKRVRRPDGSMPHFELVVGTQNMNASAVHDELIAYRVVD